MEKVIIFTYVSWSSSVTIELDIYYNSDYCLCLLPLTARNADIRDTEVTVHTYSREVEL